jgi:hypothetical protein
MEKSNYFELFSCLTARLASRCSRYNLCRPGGGQPAVLRISLFEWQQLAAMHPESAAAVLLLLINRTSTTGIERCSFIIFFIDNQLSYYVTYSSMVNLKSSFRHIFLNISQTIALTARLRQEIHKKYFRLTY